MENPGKSLQAVAPGGAEEEDEGEWEGEELAENKDGNIFYQ